MRTQYLRLSAYLCNKCHSPVVAGSLSVRESEISKESDVRMIGALCLSCGHRQQRPSGPGIARELPPIEWEPVDAIDARHLATAFADALHRSEVH